MRQQNHPLSFPFCLCFCGRKFLPQCFHWAGGGWKPSRDWAESPASDPRHLEGATALQKPLEEVCGTTAEYGLWHLLWTGKHLPAVALCCASITTIILPETGVKPSPPHQQLWGRGGGFSLEQCSEEEFLWKVSSSPCCGVQARKRLGTLPHFIPPRVSCEHDKFGQKEYFCLGVLLEQDSLQIF